MYLETHKNNLKSNYSFVLRTKLLICTKYLKISLLPDYKIFHLFKIVVGPLNRKADKNYHKYGQMHVHLLL